MPCLECGAARLIHDDVGSLVCTDCGTLADPSQAVLADHTDHASSTYVALRTSKGWHLAQTKQDRDRRNMIAMKAFITSVLSRLHNPGLASRAEAIFTQAMVKGHYRWGQKAKLTAGASIAISLREARKSDSFHDIAFFLDETPVSLSRAFRSVVSLLEFALDATDPAVHLPLLQAHLQSIIHPDTASSSSSSTSQLPKLLVSTLKTLPLQVAVRTAASLSEIMSHHSPPLPLIHLPTPPTACALLILGLEAEARAPLPHLGELARTLAARFALAHGVVSSRYKTLYDQIEAWIRHVPWLDQFSDKTKRNGPAARSKSSKRSVVAKGIKDVIQFQQEIWLSHMHSQQRVILDLELDPSDPNEEERNQEDSDGIHIPTSTSSNENVQESAIVQPLAKRRKVDREGDVMQAAHRRLCDLSSYGSFDATTFDDKVSLVARLPTCRPGGLSRARSVPLTRLQLLAASRGGSTVEYIADEELFVDGELEGLLRSEQEQVALQPLFELNWGQETSKGEVAVCNQKSIATEMKRGAKRVNMDALARLLGVNADGDSNDKKDMAGYPVPGNDAYLRSWDDYGLGSSGYQTTVESTELVGDWRPLTPDDDDTFGTFHSTADDRYEEEL